MTEHNDATAKEIRDNNIVQIRHAAVRLLAQREYSQKELLRKLSQKGFELILIQHVILDLTSQGLQSQQRFGEMLIRARIAKGYGFNKIKQELEAHGLDTEMRQNCLAEIEIDWFELCQSQKVKKFGSEPLPDWKLQQKCRRFLYQRGFTEEQIRYAMEN